MQKPWPQSRATSGCFCTCMQIGQLRGAAAELDEEVARAVLDGGASPQRCRTSASCWNQASCSLARSQPCSRRSTKPSSRVTSRSSTASLMHLSCLSTSSARFIITYGAFRTSGTSMTIWSSCACPSDTPSMSLCSSYSNSEAESPAMEPLSESSMSRSPGGTRNAGASSRTCCPAEGSSRGSAAAWTRAEAARAARSEGWRARETMPGA
mmetsp:Transcript_109040/g.305179  ORF Transcript_109040/g.305179 Transcript_109040/m.305179 type:complete len:210 (+) Transcript_109040:1252-1881(+)